MPKQRSRRRAAPVDLGDLDPIESSEVQALPTTILMTEILLKVELSTTIITLTLNFNSDGEYFSAPCSSVILHIECKLGIYYVL
jgi:hypothetical protein